MPRFIGLTIFVMVLLPAALEIRRFTEAAKATKPRQSSPRKMEKLQTADTAATTCKNILKKKPNAPSGTYTVTTNSGDLISIYCEMGLNGGGYTFLTPMSLTSLTDAEIQAMFTDRTTFLLRVRKTNGTQPYAVLRQLSPEYSNISLTLGLSSHDGFNPPRNQQDGNLEPPFVFFGFIPQVNYPYSGKIGLTVNGNSVTFKNCDTSQHSQFALYTNFKEAKPTTYTYPSKVCDLMFDSLLPNPSGRLIPPEFFFFGETVWGGCGCYVQTNMMKDITGFNIGFR